MAVTTYCAIIAAIIKLVEYLKKNALVKIQIRRLVFYNKNKITEKNYFRFVKSIQNWAGFLGFVVVVRGQHQNTNTNPPSHKTKLTKRLKELGLKTLTTIKSLMDTSRKSIIFFLPGCDSGCEQTGPGSSQLDQLDNSRGHENPR